MENDIEAFASLNTNPIQSVEGMNNPDERSAVELEIGTRT
jgi:hypothetical protein